MSAFRSAPGGHARLRWSDYLLGSLAAWLAPAGAAGVIVPALAWILGIAGVGAAGEMPVALFAVQVFGQLAILLFWIGLVVSLPVAVAAIRTGVFGWASALIAGGALGAGAGLVLSQPGPVLTAPSGAVSALVFWAVLRLRRPDAIRAARFT